MPHDEKFSAALRLAECFIKNGDVRLGHSTRPDSDNLTMLGDLIVGLYTVIEMAEVETGKGNVSLTND
jgi:hypothetical protein